MPHNKEKALEAVYGKWGTLYRDHLIKHDKEKYYKLLCSGALHEYITEVDLTADRLYEETVSRMIKQNSATEKLRKTDPELFKIIMKKITDEAAETVCREVIFKGE